MGCTAVGAGAGAGAAGGAAGAAAGAAGAAGAAAAAVLLLLSVSMSKTFYNKTNKFSTPAFSRVLLLLSDENLKDLRT
jgi:hypothetical protein